MTKVIRARTHDAPRRHGKDQAPTIRTELTRYRGAHYTAEREGDDLVIFISQPGIDPVVDPAAYGVNYAPEQQERQATGDRSFIGRLNARNRDFWARGGRK